MGGRVSFDESIAFHQNKYVRQALALSKRGKDVLSTCEYTDDAQQITSTRCGQRNLCMATAVCLFAVDTDPDISTRIVNIDFNSDTTYISRAFQVVCSALADGDCPPAEDCLFDRTFLEARKNKSNQPTSGNSPQSKTLKTEGIR